MIDKLMYIPDDDKQNYPFCFEAAVVTDFKMLWLR